MGRKFYVAQVLGNGKEQVLDSSTFRVRWDDGNCVDVAVSKLGLHICNRLKETDEGSRGLVPTLYVVACAVNAVVVVPKGASRVDLPDEVVITD